MALEAQLVVVNPIYKQAHSRWQDNSLLWSMFFTDAALEAIRTAGLMGDMRVTCCPVVR